MSRVIFVRVYSADCRVGLFLPQVRDVEAVLHRVKTDLHNCVGFIQEPKKLKESIRQVYARYIQQSDVVRWTHTHTHM